MSSIICDTHTHTHFSEDSTALPEAMVQRAIDLGLSTLCFTEHMDLDFPDEGLFQVDLPAYHAEYQRLRKRYSDKIDLLFGLELGMQPHLPAAYKKMASEWPFDFLIASQHLVNGEDPYEQHVWKDVDETEIIRQYFRELYSNLQSMTDFDTCAHLDYVVRYAPKQRGHYDYTVYADLIEPILLHLIREGKCLEVNAAGLKYGLGAPNPTPTILRRYYDLGGQLITIGSDAHEPAHLAYDFATVEQILRKIGFTEYAIFRHRERETILL